MSVGTRAERLHLRLFLEGVEIPVISATITLPVHSIGHAIIQVIGTPEAMNLRPRTLVELYVRTNDPNRRASDVARLPVAKHTDKGVIREWSDVVLFGDDYVRLRNGEILRGVTEDDVFYELLFLGELTGFSTYSDQQSNVINLLCSDLTNHFDTMTQYTFDANAALFMAGINRFQQLSGFLPPNTGVLSYSDAVNGEVILRNNVNRSAGSSGIDPGATIASGVYGIHQKIANILADRGLPEGLREIYNFLRDSYVFYKDIDEELFLRSTLDILDDLEARDIFRSAQALQYIRGYIAKTGPVNTLRTLLKIIFYLLNYEFVPTTASAVYTDKVEGGPGVRLSYLKQETPFAEPPACNIVFPDEVYSFNFSRNFVSEPTRGVESTDWVGHEGNDGSIFNRFVIVPVVDIDDNGNVSTYAPIEMYDLVSNMDRNLQAFGRTLLPEEIFKGIISIASFSSYTLRTAYITALREKSGVGENPTARLRNNVPVEEERDSLDLLDIRFFGKEATYKFIKKRYNARTSNASCKLLPRVVPGFTALVMDRVVRRTVSEESKFSGYVGYVLQVTHSVSQAGGVTTLAMNYVRPTNEVLDFFKTTQSNDVQESVEIIPDLRQIYPPWAKNTLSPESIKDSYVQWFGGFDWRGNEVTEDVALGILPTSVAVVTHGNFVNPGDPNVGEFPYNFWYVTRKLISTYQDLVVRTANQTVEQLANRLTYRPIATLLQIRGLLNAYFDLKGKLQIGTSSRLETVIRVQRVLAALGYYTGQIDGTIGLRTKAAITAYSSRARDKFGIDITVYDDISEELIRALNYELSSLVQTNSYTPPASILDRDLGIITHRIFRRSVRLRAVENYKESINIARGLRG